MGGTKTNCCEFTFILDENKITALIRFQRICKSKYSLNNNRKTMEWKSVKHSRSRKPIGAIGFLNNKIAAVATYYSDKDWDHDGKVSAKERFGSMFGLGGKAYVEVLTQAYSDPDLFMKDPNGMRQFHGNAVTQFASGMMLDGIYITYFKMGISQACGALAANLVKGSATRFVVRKGMEQAVKRAYNTATR